jgi:hypothetical protein
MERRVGRDLLEMLRGCMREQRRGRGVAWLGLVGALVLLAAPSTAITIEVGTPPGSRSFIPFGGLSPELSNEINMAIIAGDPLPVPRFQQVYDASLFGSIALRVRELEFFADTGDQIGNAGLLGGTTCSGILTECGLVTIRLSTTSRSPDDEIITPASTLSETNFDGNLEGATAIFAQQILLEDYASAGTDGGLLTIPGTPFLYDPLTDGNLIIDIQFTDFGTTADLTQGRSTLLFDGSDETGVSPLPYSVVDNYDGLDNTGFGLVTTFDFTTVPEPSAALLLGGGLIGIALRRRVRR